MEVFLCPSPRRMDARFGLHLLLIGHVLLISVSLSEGRSHCPSRDFSCSNGKCVQRKYVCDGENDCGDYEDEKYCDSSTERTTTRGPPTCSPREFKCDNGRCILEKYLCDGEDDCGDWTDERRCYTKTPPPPPRYTSRTSAHPRCSSREFECQNGRCIEKMFVCDNDNDCGDASDEQHCGRVYTKAIPPCPASQFSCYNRKCIDKSFVCNGQDDCGDNTDERNCTRSCAPTDFLCKNEHCIPRKFVCDNFNDCGDHSDEGVCGCGTGLFRCESGPCIRGSDICNGFRDCPENSDENNCYNQTCSSADFACGNGRCVSNMSLCDGHNDCGDNFDEKNCDNLKISSLDGVKEALRKGIEWLISQRQDYWGWKQETPRAIVALSLAYDGRLSKNPLESDLMVKQLNLEIQTALWKRPHLPSTELALFINALLATCQNPYDFQKVNLVAEISEKTRPERAFVYLALCNAGGKEFQYKLHELKEVINDERKEPHILDNQMMASLAFACAKREYPDTENTDEIYLKNILYRLKKMQRSDGSFGNIYTTALAVQTLIATGNKRQDVLAPAVKYLLRQQQSDGSFGDFLATYYILPLLADMSLIDVDKVHCSDTKSGTPADEGLKPGEMKIQYSIWVGEKVQYSHTTDFILHENITAFDIMKKAALKDSKFRMKWTMAFDDPYIYSISGVANDPDHYRYWSMYASKINKPNPTPVNQGVSRFKPTANTHLIMWYKQT